MGKFAITLLLLLCKLVFKLTIGAVMLIGVLVSAIGVAILAGHKATA